MPQILVTGTASAAPIPLASVPTGYHKCTIIACNGLGGPTTSPNTSPINLGYSQTAGQQPIVMNPGDERNFDAPPNGRAALEQLYLTVQTTGDGVVVVYR